RSAGDRSGTETRRAVASYSSAAADQTDLEATDDDFERASHHTRDFDRRLGASDACAVAPSSHRRWHGAADAGSNAECADGNAECAQQRRRYQPVEGSLERTGFLSSRIVTNMIPVMLALMGTLLSNVPLSFTGNHVPAPLLGLMPVYFWCLVRPDLMSPMWALLIGLLEDMLAPGPPGLWAAAYVTTYAVISRQRDVFAGLSGYAAILGFATAAFIACGSAYLIKCALDWRLLPIGSIAGELLTSVILYVPIATFLGNVHRRFVGPLRSDF